jgi:hypothetical protein
MKDKAQATKDSALREVSFEKLGGTIQSLNLRYEFDEEEIKEKGMELANEEFNAQQTTAEFTQVKADWNSRIKTIEGNINKLATAIRDGFEMRDVECKVRMNDPKPGKKTITRSDTGSSYIEQMTEEDEDLFS